MNSFELCGIERTRLESALLKMLPSALKGFSPQSTKAMREEWSKQNPTRFCCYFVSEFVYWFLAPSGSVAMSLEVAGDDTLHRFIKYPSGEIVDLTCQQFPFVLDYSKSKPRMFMQTGGVGPSKRAKKLAELLGFDASNFRKL